MSKVDEKLITILSWPRGHASGNELDFRVWVKKQLPKYTEMAGNIVYDNGGQTLFSCHMDTVGDHLEIGVRKKLMYDSEMGLITLADDSPGTCLGADDGAGIWLMLEMIKAGVPGAYVFHIGEECGGVGSREMVVQHSQWLKNYDAAVAFDRPHFDEVISHQRGVRCASDKYCLALAAAVSLRYRPSDKGVFTDTANYRQLIPECVNLGVGYEMQHGRKECQDWWHLCALRDALLTVKWDKLPIERDPAKQDFQTDWFGSYAPKVVKPKVVKPKPPSSYDEVMMCQREDLEIMCEESPDVMAGYIVDMAADIAGLRAQIVAYKKLLGVRTA